MNLSDKLTLPFFKLIGEQADRLGVEAYVVGGWVRDLVMNRPCKDIDFVCVGSGIELAKAVATVLGPDVHVTVFKNFGTAHIAWQDYQFEFVGARKESYRSESRKPIVEDGTLEDDQWRRDFTINAMAIRINEKGFGELIDPFNGLGDIQKKLFERLPTPPLLFPMTRCA